MPTYIDVHVLQTVPPSNLNRDDAGSPKQAVYGGARRARVSSQAWKRATRKLLAHGMPEADRSTRTKRISTLLAARLREATSLEEEQANRLATAILKPLGIKPGKKATDTAYLLFFGRSQLDGVVRAVADRAARLVDLGDKALDDEVKELAVQDDLMRGHPLDVALFGRMVADIPAINVDAATQVAHAISTHAVDIEFDYFTAVDDEQTVDDDAGPGAAMIGTVEFNSATLYRYATLGLEQLIDNLGGADEHTADGVERFVDAFVRSMPTGHQTSFAHRTLPGLVAVAVRDDQPVNLVSAFEQPVYSIGGYLARSAARLAREHNDVATRWGAAPRALFACYGHDLDDEVGQAFGPSLAYHELLSSVRKAVTDRVAPLVG